VNPVVMMRSINKKENPESSDEDSEFVDINRDGIRSTVQNATSSKAVEELDA
jgi:hypothetical protein